jgi:hypothetical protein
MLIAGKWVACSRMESGRPAVGFHSSRYGNSMPDRDIEEGVGAGEIGAKERGQSRGLRPEQQPAAGCGKPRRRGRKPEEDSRFVMGDRRHRSPQRSRAGAGAGLACDKAPLVVFDADGRMLAARVCRSFRNPENGIRCFMAGSRALSRPVTLPHVPASAAHDDECADQRANTQIFGDLWEANTLNRPNKSAVHMAWAKGHA